jgi:hypothetical protein
MHRNIRFMGSAALAVFGLVAPRAGASTAASSTYTVEQLGSNSYQYDFTLTNTGTTPIGTFWFGWLPGYDLLPSIPSRVISPAGWTGNHEEEGFTGSTSSVEWDSTSLLQPGQTMSGFAFDSNDAPGTIAGPSYYFQIPVATTYVYSGPFESGTPGSLLPQAVAAPEPGTLSLLSLTAAGLLVRRRRQCQRVGAALQEACN